MAAQDAGRRVHGQDGARRRAAVVQDVGAQAQARHESIALRGGAGAARMDRRRSTLVAGGRRRRRGVGVEEGVGKLCVVLLGINSH